MSITARPPNLRPAIKSPWLESLLADVVITPPFKTLKSRKSPFVPWFAVRPNGVMEPTFKVPPLVVTAPNPLVPASVIPVSVWLTVLPPVVMLRVWTVSDPPVPKFNADEELEDVRRRAAGLREIQ